MLGLTFASTAAALREQLYLMSALVMDVALPYSPKIGTRIHTTSFILLADKMPGKIDFQTGSISDIPPDLPRLQAVGPGTPVEVSENCRQNILSGEFC